MSGNGATEGAGGRPLPAVTPRPTRVRLSRPWRMATAPLRPLPGFLVVGAQKAGTSSLFDHLCAHPQVGRSQLKETDFFSYHYARGLTWYRSHFGIGSSVVGEASPSYLYHPCVPERVARDLPGVRLVVLLRDPVERALSHYEHERRRGLEPLGLEAALAAEEDRIAADREAITRDPLHRATTMRHYSYVDRGRYAEQLERWFAHHDRDRMLILCSETYAQDTATEFGRVQEFLGLDAWQPPAFERRNVGERPDVPDRLRAQLAQGFADANERLFELLGERLPWGQV